MDRRFAASRCVRARKAAVLTLSGKARGVSFAADSKTPLAADNLQDQFVVFQMNPKAEGPTILESSQVDPLIDGSPEEPDVLTSLEMLSFVSFRQACVRGQADLFLREIGRQDAAHRGVPDLETAGDLGFADASAM